MGKPASMTSTPKATRAWAISIFSARFMLAPGDCSPSRSVVSKIVIRREAAGVETVVSVMMSSRFDKKTPGPWRPRGSLYRQRGDLRKP